MWPPRDPLYAGSVTTAGPPLIVVAGATGTGKTRLAIDLALAIRAQGRRGRGHLRGLATGVPRPGHRNGQGDRRPSATSCPITGWTRSTRIPHSASPISYSTHAPRSPTLAARDGVAILAGGTGLYLRAVARGIDTDALPSDQQVRSALERELETDGPPCPRRALDRRGTDARGRRRPAQSPARDPGARDRRAAGRRADARGCAATTAPRCGWASRSSAETLKPRLAARARAQFDGGLIEEARALRERFDPAPTAHSAPSGTGRRGRSWTARSTARPRSTWTPSATGPSRNASGRGFEPSRTSPGWTRPRAHLCRPHSPQRTDSSGRSDYPTRPCPTT